MFLRFFFIFFSQMLNPNERRSIQTEPKDLKIHIRDVQCKDSTIEVEQSSPSSSLSLQAAVDQTQITQILEVF